MSIETRPPHFPKSFFEELDQRSRSIFRTIVETYMETGDPLGSRNISRQLSIQVSPATVRNVMADLESLGLIYSPHTSAGRLPTDLGLRFFVDSFMQIGDLDETERRQIETQMVGASEGQSFDKLLTEASQVLSGLSQSAGLVIANKNDLRLKHIEFVRLEPTKALVVIVGENGLVENRVINLPQGTTASSLIEAANYVNARIAGRTLKEARGELNRLHNVMKSELNELSQKLVDQGIAVWAGSANNENDQLIVAGHGHLLENVSAVDDIERVRQLFDELETKQSFMNLLELAEGGEGVRIFIGSENKLFSLSGSSVIVAPYRDKEKRVVGALGVIGPTRLNYSRIVPMVDYTAQLISKLLR